MKIFLDTTYLEYGSDLRGVAQVVYQFIRLCLTASFGENLFFIATKPVKSILSQRFSIPEKRIMLVSRIPILFNSDRFHGFLCDWRYRNISKIADLIIHPEFRTVLNCAVNQVVLFHDFMHFEKPSLGGEKKISRRLVYYHKMRRAVRAKYKIANSYYTKKMALIRFPYLLPESITVLHLGARFIGNTCTRRSPRPLNPNAQFLYVGSIEERKNVLNMISKLDVVLPNKNSELHLVGKITATERKKLNHVINQFNMQNNVIIHGLVSDGELVRLYADAHFFLFPSLIEGFGLPIIEAMSFGKIVFAFNNSTIKEIGEKAVVLAENYDFASWGKEIINFLNNRNEYKKKAELSKKQAAKFSESAMFARYQKYFSKIIASL
ncbi:MAG: glycosyltransferase [Chitinivibrionales bacterium]|nr:glycosyltransferase [Chitinivibrionales bacterium]